ncbi:MAG TPA: sulfur oxidation c-type cytochrome SoxA [Burkholderiaceae bacterium]|jgi:sulfur-oxidizing protein SoxA
MKTRLCPPVALGAAALALAALSGPAPVLAQTSTAEGIAQYRALLADGNPADLWEAKGELLWKQKRGSKNVSLEGCDLGKGPGVVKGAFVELPRWFKDTGRVQDLESRLLTCLQAQGFDPAAIAATPFGTGEQVNIEALVTYVAAASKDMRFNLPQDRPEERRMAEVGKRLFYFRAGPYDFSCASCHGEPGKRIRLQDLPDLTKNPGDGIGFAAWPAYRVSSGELWSMQRRLNDCFRQQRFPFPGYASDATIALSTFMGVQAHGAVSIAPGIKR